MGSGSGGNNPVTAFNLPGKRVSVWHYAAPTPSTPQVGNVNPVMGRPNVEVTIVGKGFGSSTGSVRFRGTNATIVSWSDTGIKARVPSGISGANNITVRKAGSSTDSNAFEFNVLSGEQVPVTFKVRNASPTQMGDYIYLTGNKPELSNWSTGRSQAVGPEITHAGMYPDWFVVASVPANTAIEYKHIKIEADNDVVWEAGSNHTYTTPAGGSTGFVEVWWQY